MKTENNKYKSFDRIVNLIYNETLENIGNIDEELIENSERVRIEPNFIYDNLQKQIALEIYIGNTTMYKIKKLSEFYDRMLNCEKYKYGDKLEFIHSRKNIDESCLPLLNFILKYSEMIKYGNINSNANYRFGAKALSESKIIIDEKALDEVFEALKGEKVNFESNLKEGKIEFVECNPEIKFFLEKINKQDYIFTLNIDAQKLHIINGYENKYVLIKDKLYKCDKNFEKDILKLLEAFQKNYISQVILNEKQLPEFFSIIIPKIKDNIDIKEKELEKFFPQELTSRLYLDFNTKNFLVADLRFVYDGVEYNPLDNTKKYPLSRNIIEETLSLNYLRKTGFMLDSKNARFVLTDDEKIFEFINFDLNNYMKKFEILASEKFKKKQMKQPKISNLGIKIENNLLEIDLKNIDINKAELIEILEKYKLKKKYHRLKDGTFIDLENSKDLAFLGYLATGTDINYEELKTGIIRLPINRTMYLEQLLDNLEDTKIDKNENYKTVVKQLSKNNIVNEITIPWKIKNVLRDYQKTGYKWLKTLDYFNFGGILADDMGLGKTLQLLAVIMAYIEETKEKERKSSIVVSPSSLALNWESEAKKFAPELKILVISGTALERKKQINNLEDYDLIITSYDLLKRDIDYYNEKDYEFKYIIADEAQYLKNSNTQNAIAIKQIRGETRFALTGTPMENSLSELWSIFDFIMPGYLFSHRTFKNMYEAPIVKDKDKKAMEKLKMLIEPFVLRRTKKEVLKELPDKTVSVLTSNMLEEQKNIYLSYLLEAKQEVKDTIDINGLEKSHMKILAVLTRLRQICCHPSVFIENYEGGSCKLDQCMELIRDGISSDHRILLFSGYTSIFPIIEKELKEYNIKYFKLTGSTKVGERISLVNEFNDNDEIKVFLISLKAGGTGLNLTGADMVIHYDPWWNASAENQATDRAYRIGQKNNVQVYKLITKDSIEEKINEMQQNKSALIDNMLDINTTFVNKLSKEEIMELFE